MQDIEMTPLFSKAFKEMQKGQKTLFITGKAGTGKSTLLRYFYDSAKDKPVLLAPTGVAALNVEGQTIHRFFRFKIDVTPDTVASKKYTSEERKFYNAVKTIIIDEASMVRADLLDCVDILLRKCRRGGKNLPFGGVRMIFFGDLYQIPPVVTSQERAIFQDLYASPYFFHAKVMESMDLEIIELDKIYRQKDRYFIEILNRIRNNTSNRFDIEKLNSRCRPKFKVPKNQFWITLTGTNQKADEVNQKQLDSLSGKSHLTTAKVTGTFGKEHYPTAVELSFKEGAQIMMVNNDPEGRWVNGSIGVVSDVVSMDKGQESLLVRLDGQKEVVLVQRVKWELVQFVLARGKLVSQPAGKFSQLPFRLAWAVTTHKSQGKTYQRLVFDCDKVFGFGQTYVALSRCANLEGLVLRRPLTAKDIRTDWRVRKFLTDWKYKRASAKLSTTEKLKMIENAISSGKDLQISYLTADDTQTNRVIRPISIGQQEYKGYSFEGLKAFCRWRQGERVFKVDRILTLALVTKN